MEHPVSLATDSPLKIKLSQLNASYEALVHEVVEPVLDAGDPEAIVKDLVSGVLVYIPSVTLKDVVSPLPKQRQRPRKPVQTAR